MNTTKTTQNVVIERNVSCQTIADEIASRITGKLIGFDDLYDPKTQQFLTEKELKAKGAVFVTISMNKVLNFESDLVKKSRITKEPTPFIRKETKYQVIGNVNWQSYVNKRGHGDFVPAENRANGIVNYECKAVGKTSKGYFTINGVAFRVLEATKYFDENGVEYKDKIALQNEYFKTTVEAEAKAKQKEADKHGIDVRFDPKYRTTRIDSCNSVRCFGFDYKPTENHAN